MNLCVKLRTKEYNKIKKKMNIYNTDKLGFSDCAQHNITKLINLKYYLNVSCDSIFSSLSFPPFSHLSLPLFFA
jgi:hypothetical protein